MLSFKLSYICNFRGEIVYLICSEVSGSVAIRNVVVLLVFGDVVVAGSGRRREQRLRRLLERNVVKFKFKVVATKPLEVP